METLSTLNPVWLVLVVNLIAVFLVPFLTFRFAHRNNLNTLREKWISDFRSSSAAFVEACSILYYANDTRYQKLGTSNVPPDAERAGYIKRCEEAQAKVAAARAKIRLLFKDGDSGFAQLEPLLDAYGESVDKPVKSAVQLQMDPAFRDSAQHGFLRQCNKILEGEWKKISGEKAN